MPFHCACLNVFHIELRAMNLSPFAHAGRQPFPYPEQSCCRRELIQRVLQVLKSISKSENVIPTTIEYVDIAGLVKGASTGEGLGNKFLANIRECDSIVQVGTVF